MAMTRKDIIKNLKAQQKPEKGNVTFRLSTDVVEKFRTACESDGFKAGVVIEEFMKGYIKDKRAKNGS